MPLINSGCVHLVQKTILAHHCIPNFGPEHAACVPSLEMLVPPSQALVHEANIRACVHKKVLSRPTGAEQRGQSILFPVVFTPSPPPHPQPLRQCLGPTYHFLNLYQSEGLGILK
jgi:hypothetical protein